ncbi:hypothetical protein HN51_034193 [Arachis hypogaea]|uniref:Uncharacterized protein n=1 Tax=Arachis hypogaea TaxID=3818 RepID=A0A445A957_ARAHY|nr:protein CLAVATA 3 [Arachis ipaensis]XP_025641016.1 protein CLAVATA 3 [Arachis hypogaea]QHN99016.1 uncharacterized protein DS421_13g394250 [Arachis hypogaea]RYR22986.1 hypothetical protein Ahy_B03g068261 [Arachis hypogaea]
MSTNMAMILTLVIFLLFAQPSTSSRVYGANLAGGKTISTSIEVGRFGNNGADPSVGRVVEDSTRKVPTGPDPLHHNNNPLRP